MFGLLCGCEEQNITIQLKQEQFKIELGNPIQTEAYYYLNLENLEDEEKEYVKENAKFSVEVNDDDYIEKYDLKYEKEGTYHATIQLQKQVLNFDILIQDTSVPVILGNSEDELEVFDYNDVDDLDIVENVVTVKDAAGNQAVKIINQEIKDYVKMDVPYYNQMDVDAPNGCEATSLYMALKYKDKIDIDLTTFIQDELYDSNPYYGFSGNPFGRKQNEDDYFTVFATPIAEYGSQYTPCYDISHSNLEDIKAYLSQDCPVVVWGTGKFKEPQKRTFYFGEVTENLHIVLLTGYDEEKGVFFLRDPYRENYQEVEYDQFESVYKSMPFAVAVCD